MAGKMERAEDILNSHSICKFKSYNAEIEVYPSQYIPDVIFRKLAEAGYHYKLVSNGKLYIW